jgi:hypothetical protein
MKLIPPRPITADEVIFEKKKLDVRTNQYTCSFYGITYQYIVTYDSLSKTWSCPDSMFSYHYLKEMVDILKILVIQKVDEYIEDYTTSSHIWCVSPEGVHTVCDKAGSSIFTSTNRNKVWDYLDKLNVKYVRYFTEQEESV